MVLNLRRNKKIYYPEKTYSDRLGRFSRGNGAYQSIKKGKNVINEFEPYTFEEGKEYSMASLFADDLLIKETGVDVFKVDMIDSTLFYNNHSLRIKQ